MVKTFFRYKNHPSDLLHDSSIQLLPDFQNDRENFRVWFHPNYSNSQSVAYLNDLYKWFDDEFEDDKEKYQFESWYGKMNNEEIKNQIELTENQLDFESLINFYALIQSQKIEIIQANGKKK